MNEPTSSVSDPGQTVVDPGDQPLNPDEEIAEIEKLLAIEQDNFKTR
ncbi:MAG: hypothetical protein ITD28_07705 [Nitrospira sp.]|nr:hypothetical protein [Nitrospira sp.]